ncbi:MFS transporter [Planosporangium thailandense]|uniref:MFS transporter n=1 Tax=Planosporangium thailandense TaxID=765197 RepID=A0ABX0Y4B1_9ACTN|nr:MFS transporter [Planosporangium thailandense]
MSEDRSGLVAADGTGGGEPLPEALAGEATEPTGAAGDGSEGGRGWLARHAIDVRPLRHPAYRRMFIGSAVSFFGYQFTAVAVPVQMFALTHSSAWVGYLGVAGLVPLLIFALWGGAVADAFDRRLVLLASSLLMWASTLGLFAQGLFGLRSPALLLVLVAVQSVAFAVSAPTRSAIVPRLIPEHEVAAGNTLNYTMSNVGTVAGPLGAGLVLARFPVATAYAVDAVLFTVALWAALRLPAMAPERVDRTTSRMADVLFGLRYLATTPVLLLSFAVDIAAMTLALPRALFPQAATDRFGGVGAVGWLFSAIAIGSVVAGLTSGWIGRVRRQGIALVAAVVVWGLAVAAAGLAHSLWLAVILLAVGGAADLVSAVYRQTMLQTYAPDELRGRMQGVFTAVVAGGPRLGDLRAGLMAQGLGLTITWVGGGLAASVVAVALVVAFPALRRYTAR